MISVIIPLMPVEPYNKTYKDTIAALDKQTVTDFCEYITVEQNITKYIHKTKLLNEGVKRSTEENIWFCDADFMPEPTLLERMYFKLDGSVDVIFPMFYSEKHKQLKIADGAPFMDYTVFEEYGGLNEDDLGISWVTFPFLKWCMDNTKFHCSDEFIIDINPTPQRKAGKRHWKTSGKLRGLYKETVKELQEMGVWP